MRFVGAAMIPVVLALSGAAALPGRIIFTLTVGSEQLYHASANGHVMQRLTSAVTDNTDPAVSPDGRFVAYDADPHGNYDVYTRTIPGGAVVDLTPYTASDDYYPAWSPDGSRIAFISNRASSNSQVFVMNADGSNVVQLTHNALPHELPSWSPDGKRILFDTSAYKHQGDIYSVNDDGTGLTRITSSAGDEWNARWSPDGTWIAYTTGRVDIDPEGYIWLVRPDGSAAHVIPNQPGDDAAYPNWSHDGQTIAFSQDHGDCGIWTMSLDGTHRKLAANVCNLGGGSASGDHLFWAGDGSFWFASGPISDGDLAVVSAAGGNPVAITHDDAADETQPAPSPDGKTIAFTSDRIHEDNIWLMNADGTHVRDISQSRYDDEEPAWSPDGRQIAFATDRGPKTLVEVYLMNRDGSDQRALTTLPGNSNQPDWSPDGRWIAFSNFPPHGHSSIWVVHPDGTGLHRLGQGESSVWSPSGKALAYLREDHVWRMDADGSHTRELVQGDDPAWSPDGARIAFGRTFVIGRGSFRIELWVMNANGHDRHSIAIVCDGAHSGICDGVTPQERWDR